MSTGWAPVAFDAAGDWQLWLALTGVLALCWGFVVVATATLFGGWAGVHHRRRFATHERGGVRSDKPTHDGTQRAGMGNG